MHMWINCAREHELPAGVQDLHAFKVRPNSGNNPIADGEISNKMIA